MAVVEEKADKEDAPLPVDVMMISTQLPKIYSKIQERKKEEKEEKVSLPSIMHRLTIALAETIEASGKIACSR